MADNSKNKAFLQQLERQRLNKPCNRIIDLRGKVAGECQAYIFGNLTHYLDDRAYLLAKQLLDRFDGRYTTGVYEVLLKALKSIKSPNTKTDARPILQRDKNDVQIINLDSLLYRKEPRIIHTTAIQISIADMLYHATTVNITTSALRVTLKRAFTLEKNSLVTVNFLDLINTSQPDLLTKVHYKILNIEHDERHTYAILVRNRTDDNAITSWLSQWTQRHNTPENIDINNELFNISIHYYLRLFISNMRKPLFWTDKAASDNNVVKVFHSSSTSNVILQPLESVSHEIDFSLLPFQQILDHQSNHLFIIYKQDNIAKSLAVPCSETDQMFSTMNWFSQQENVHFYLVKTLTASFDLNDFGQEIAVIAESDNDYAKELAERLSTISNLITLTDITDSCQNLPHTTASAPSDIINNQPSWSGSMPQPNALSPYINRKTQRLFIKTNVEFDLSNTSCSVTTNDVSTSGISLSLPGFVDTKTGTKLSVLFKSWQRQTSTVKLNTIPFTIKRVQFWQGVTTLGLERNISTCAESVNRFFNTELERNKQRLTEDNADILTIQETKIFSYHLGQKITSTPLFFGKDSNNNRILQAVASSQSNQADKLSGLWREMQSLVLPIYNSLNKALHKAKTTLSFGIYCYLDNSGQWHLMMEGSLASSSKKAVFINRALTHKIHYFFHCTASLINTDFLEQQGDLNQQLARLRSHSPHKVQQIRNVLQSLFAIGELTDVTDIISASYRS